MGSRVETTHVLPAHDALKGIHRLSYVTTVLVAAGNVGASVVATAILARSWSETEFLLYGSLNRYSNFLFTIASGCLGFGVVRYFHSDDAAVRRRVLPNAAGVVGLLSLIVLCGLLLARHRLAELLDISPALMLTVIAGGGVWITAQAFLHLSLAWLRGTGQSALANRLHSYAKTLVLLCASCLIAASTLSVSAYLGVVGVAVLVGCGVALWQQTQAQRRELDLRLCRGLVGFSSTRLLDNVLKHAATVTIITLIYVHGNKRLAGEAAVITMLMRGIEALCQPLVMLVMADSLSATDEPERRRKAARIWTALLLVAVPLSVVAFVLARPLIAVYLGNKYSYLAPEFAAMSLTLLPAIGLIVLRGFLDSTYRVSPLLWINGAGLLLVFAVMGEFERRGQLTLSNTAWLIVTLRWLQFAVVFLLFRRAFGVRLLDLRLMREACLRVRNRLRCS